MYDARTRSRSPIAADLLELRMTALEARVADIRTKLDEEGRQTRKVLNGWIAWRKWLRAVVAWIGVITHQASSTFHWGYETYTNEGGSSSATATGGEDMDP